MCRSMAVWALTCGVGLDLDGIELGLGEVTHWKGAPNAEPANGLAEDLTSPSREPTGVHHSGTLIALLLEHLHLLDLVHGRLVTPKAFDGFGARDMGDCHCLSLFPRDS